MGIVKFVESCDVQSFILGEEGLVLSQEPNFSASIGQIPGLFSGITPAVERE
jgi:hypothetical protein